jgi:putative transposase
VSLRRSCSVVGALRSTQCYRARRPDDSPLRMRLRELAAARPRFGCRRLHVLLRREGWHVNHKRTYRLYCEEDLAVRRKRPRKRLSHLRVTPLAPTGPNQRWSMDFVADSLHDGRKFRILTVMDVFTRECLWSRNLRVSVATARPEHSRNRRST